MKRLPLPAFVLEADWRAKLKWFGAEIVIVVAGVLIALAINAWWGARQDRTRERAYLHQLVGDLRETEHLVADADSIMRAGPNVALTNLLRSWGQADRPPRDSVLTWMYALSTLRTPRPVLGTAEALVTTGDLTLLRDDSLRSAVTAYLDQNRDLLELQTQIGDLELERLVQIGDRFDAFEARLLEPASAREQEAQQTFIPGTVPTGDWAPPFPLDVEAFYRDRQAYGAVSVLATMHSNLTWLRGSMLQSAEALRKQVEAELNR